MEDLEGKIALVTGASVRLGRALALELARNGCDLILHHRTSRRQAKELQTELQTLGRRAAILSADLSQSGQALRLAREAEKVFGRVDILVNNAAVFHPTPIEKLTADELDFFLSVNLRSPFILSSEIGRRMKRRGWGVIVNLACVSAFRPWKTHLPYSISKAGVAALTTGLAKVLAPEVRVNAIAPGPVLPPALWFLIKTLFFVAFFILVRGSLPRVRYDQLMALGWKVMLPLGLANLMATAAIILVRKGG